MRIGKTQTNFSNNLNLPRLSGEQKQSCEVQIFVEKITAILNSSESNKYPGPSSWKAD